MNYLNIPFPSQGRALAYDDFTALQSLAQFPQTILRSLAGSCIIEGCTFDGNGLRAGTVWLGGQLYEVQAAAARKRYLIPGGDTTTSPRPTLSGGSVDGIVQRFAVLSDAKGTGAWLDLNDENQIIRFAHRLQELTHSVGAVEWMSTWPMNAYLTTGAGQASALGWALCNGGTVNGIATADLRERFVVGLNLSNPTYAMSQTGGLAEVALTAAQNGQHTHSMDAAGSHSHYTQSHGSKGGSGGGREPYSWNEAGSDNPKTIYTNMAGDHTHNLQPSGTGDPHTNLPPYYVLAARQWVGLPATASQGN